MIWAILALLGVPLWLSAAGIAVIVTRNRALRNRPGNVPVRRRRPGKSRWTRGHGVWLHDVFAFRGSPAAWAESLIPVREVIPISFTVVERKKLHSLGSDPSIARFVDDDGKQVDFAISFEHALDLLGPFGATAAAATITPASSADL